MPRVTGKIDVDVSRRNTCLSVMAKQGDMGSRYLRVSLSDGGEKLILGDDDTVMLNVIGTDGERSAYGGEVEEDGSASFLLCEQLLERPGTLVCSVTAVNPPDERLTSASFSIEVEPAEYTGSEIEDEPEYNILVQLIAETEALKDGIEETESGINASEALRSTAEEAREESEEAREDAESARVLAETSRASAESGRVSAESGRVSAESGRVSAEASRVSAESSRVSAEEARVSAEAGRATDTAEAISECNAARDAALAIEESKADKVTGAVNGNMAGLDSDGDLTDSGIPAASVALKDGYYEQMTVGSSDNLTGRGDGTPETFTERTTGGNADVADGTAGIARIKGNTVVWNQLTRTARWTQTSTYGNITGVWTSGQRGCVLNGTTTAQTYVNISMVLNADFMIPSGHKVYLKSNITGQVCLMNSSNTYFPVVGTKGIVELTDTVVKGQVIFQKDRIFEDEFLDVQITDLTVMFGAGNEPTTAAEFEAVYPGFYAYNAGELVSITPTGIKTTGFNQYNGTYARVLAGNAYYVSGTYTSLGFTETVGGSTEAITLIDNKFTPVKNGYVYATGAGTNLCINLSWSGYRDGEYEDYRVQTRNIPASTYFPDGMRSARNAYDELTKDKAVKRIGSVDLGTLTWVYVNGRDSTKKLFRAQYTLAKNPGGPYTANLLCVKYAADSYWHAYDNINDKTVSVSQVGTGIFVVDSDYTDAATFKTAMSGVMLYYELAEPVETEISPELNLTYLVSDFGTEEALRGDDEITAPFKADIVYGMNAVDTLRRLPENYISKASFDNFCAALGTAINKTITATYNSGTGEYDFTVSDNAEQGGE